MTSRAWTGVNDTEWAFLSPHDQRLGIFPSLIGHALLVLLGLGIWFFYRSDWVSGQLLNPRSWQASRPPFDKPAGESEASANNHSLVL